MAGSTVRVGHGTEPEQESLIDRLLALIGYLPIGLERLVQTAVGPTPRRLPVLPVTLVLLTALALLPVGQYLVDLIVRPVTVREIVDRRVGLSTRLVAVDGLALLAPFVAEPPPLSGSTRGDGYHWYAVRDSLQERRLVLVRSTIAVESLRTRSVVARIVEDPAVVSGARKGIRERGGFDPGAALGPRMLDEVNPAGHAISDVGSVAELGDRSVGDVVRIRLLVTRGIASCVPRGDCAARRLADGIGSWDILAADPDGEGWVVLRTNYPPSVAPFAGVGQHAGDLETVGRFLAQPLVRGILGWGNVLRSAHVEHDLNLPIDRLWVGPILFLTVVGVLLLGLRLGYPRFRVRALAGHGRVSDAARRPEIRCRASGRVTPPGRSPIEVADAPAILSAEPEGGSRLRLETGDERLEVTIPRELGSLGMVEAGDIVLVGGRQPALRVGWFGSQVQLVFTDAASRDAAAALVRHVG